MLIKERDIDERECHRKLHNPLLTDTRKDRFVIGDKRVRGTEGVELILVYNVITPLLECMYQCVIKDATCIVSIV